jgi:circadian clock protein KaiC
VSFDESADQIVRNLASIGVDLGAHLAAGTLHICSLRARSESSEDNIARIRRLVKELRPQNLVIDPISALGPHATLTDDEANNGAIQLLDFAKSMGLTVVGTSLVGNSMPLTEGTPLNISTVADTWIHLSYVIQAGERNRALTIIKARGVGHSNQVRELILTNEGMTLADVYSIGGEVLMGTLRWERENEANRARAAAHALALVRRQKAEFALSEATARLDTLARERKVREAELEQLDVEIAADRKIRASESSALLDRRRADEPVGGLVGGDAAKEQGPS